MENENENDENASDWNKGERKKEGEEEGKAVSTPVVSRLQVLWTEIAASGTPRTSWTVTKLRQINSGNKCHGSGTPGKRQAGSLRKLSKDKQVESFTTSRWSSASTTDRGHDSSLEDVRIQPNDAMTPNKAHFPRPRKQEAKLSSDSDSSLLSAKRLIEDALNSREKHERRLTEKLVELEAELEGSKSKQDEDNTGIVNLPTLVTGLKFRESDVSTVSMSSGVRLSTSSVLSNTSTVGSPKNVLHADLKREHIELQDEMEKMNAQLGFIKRQLRATKGHAKGLSRSTSDWADMMRQSVHSAAIKEQRRAVTQGVLVIKHSSKKRGCGARFLAVNTQSATMMWSKSISGGFSIMQSVYDNTKHGSKSLGKVSKISMLEIQRIAYGPEIEEILLHQENSKATSIISRMLDGDPEAVGRLLAIETVASTDQDRIILFEFCHADQCEEFSLGLKSYLGFAPVIGTTSSASASMSLSMRTQDGSMQGIFASEASKTPEDTSLSMKKRKSFSLGASSRFSSSPALIHRSSSGLSAFETPPQSITSKSNADMTWNSTRSTPLSMSLSTTTTPTTSEVEDRGKQSREIALLQSLLAQVATRDEYLHALNSGTVHCPIMLPLRSNRTHRHNFADQDQVIKDFIREKAVFLNATRYELGNHKNVKALFVRLERLLEKILTRSTDEQTRWKACCKDLCNELLLAASRTVIEGDVFTLCHHIFAVPGKVVLCPAMTQTEHSDGNSSNPIGIFVASDGLITIESETSYRIVGINQGIVEDWHLVRARCIEHIYLSPNLEQIDDEDERNIRHVRLEW